MFSFITKHFRKNKKDVKEVAEEPKEYEKDDSISYSFEFTGADEIAVSARDCARPNIDAVGHSFHDREDIETIVTLLEKLDIVGEKTMTTDPCTEHVLTAYKEHVPFAQVKFYDGHVQLTNDLFIGSDEKLLQKEAELFTLVKVDFD